MQRCRARYPLFGKNDPSIAPDGPEFLSPHKKWWRVTFRRRQQALFVRGRQSWRISCQLPVGFRSAEAGLNTEFGMDSVCLRGPDAQGRAERGEIFRLLLVVEVNADNRDSIDLVLKPFRHLLNERLHVDRGGKLPVDEF